MSDLTVFSIARQRAQWLSARQTVVASNVANASTPNFKAKDIVPFSTVLNGTNSGLRITNSQHQNKAGGTGSKFSIETRIDPFGKTSHSGNSVSVENEMIKGSQIAGAFSLNTNIVKAFHRMLLMSVRG